jgi:RNA polymerase sigma-70 factor (ECF subfamily)
LLDENDQSAVIRGLQAGSREAWATLYDGYSLDLWRFVARLMGGDSATVADVVQDSFLEAARSAKQFDSDRGTLWGWLTGIAYHKLLACWRQTNRVLLLRVKLAAQQFGEATRQDGLADRNALERETADSVRHVLRELPAEYAALLTAKYIDDRSLVEIANDAGSSIDAAKSKLARARREFRETYDRFTHSTDHPQRELK